MESEIFCAQDRQVATYLKYTAIIVSLAALSNSYTRPIIHGGQNRSLTLYTYGTI